MNNNTTTPVTDLPVVHSPLDPEVAERLGDDVLLSSAADTKVQRVRRTNGGRSLQSGESRAWTMGGDVD